MAKLRVMRGDTWHDIDIDKPHFSIGRAESCDYVVKSGFISRHHCEIVEDEHGQFHIRDHNTRLGTMVNDQPVRKQGRLGFGDTIRLSNRFEAVFLEDRGSGHTSTMRAVREENLRNRPHLVGMNEPVNGQEFVLDADRSLVGRDPSCEIHIDLDTVSKFHAEILTDGHRITVVDLNSSNGTFLDNKRVDRADVRSGSQLRFDRVSFQVLQSKLAVGKTGTLVRLPLDMEAGRLAPSGARQPAVDARVGGAQDMDTAANPLEEPLLRNRGGRDAVHSGAVQTGAVQTGAVHSGAVQTGAVQTGAVQTGAVHSGATQPKKPKSMNKSKLVLIVVLLLVVFGAMGTVAWFLLRLLLVGI